MKKKYLIFTLLTLFALNGLTICKGQSLDTDPALQANKLNYIDTRFCNGGLKEENLTRSLSIATKVGEKKEICIMFLNESKEKIKVRGRFPDNAIEPNGNRNCSTNYERNNPFSSFIKPIEDIIEIPAMGYKIIKTTINFPIGIEGMQKGCFVYGVVGAEQVGSMFTFVTRKVSYIDVLVQGNSDIKNKIEISNITTNLNEDKKPGISFNIENQGSTDNIVDINLEIHNLLGYRKSFYISGIVIGLDKNTSINTKDIGQNFELPRYKGPFTIEIKANYKPHFDFDISNFGLDKKILEGETLTETKSIFIFPTIPAIGLLIFIILIYFAFFRKPKVVYIQQNPNQQ